MATNPAASPIYGYDDSNNPEYFEIIGGHWIKKESVGRKKHSRVNRILVNLLEPFAEKLGGTVEQEWTIVRGEERVIPDVTFSFPEYEERDGYLVAPAFLVVESLSPGQRGNAMTRKCTELYHAWGTPYCWVMDYQKEEAYEIHKQSGSPQLVSVLTAGPDIQVPVEEIYGRLRSA